jgi:uncharacterized membrane protein
MQALPVYNNFQQGVRINEALQSSKGRVLKTSLTHEDEDRLKEMFEKIKPDKPVA